MTHTREVAGGRVRLCANHAIQQHLATQHSWGARQQLPALSPSLCPRGLWAGGGARAPLSTAGLSVGARSGPSVRPTPLPQPVCSPGLAAGDPGVLERGARQDGGRTGGDWLGPSAAAHRLVSGGSLVSEVRLRRPRLSGGQSRRSARRGVKPAPPQTPHLPLPPAWPGALGRPRGLCTEGRAGPMGWGPRPSGTGAPLGGRIRGSPGASRDTRLG